MKNGNGHGQSQTRAHLEQLLAHHQGIATAVKTTLDLLQAESPITLDTEVQRRVRAHTRPTIRRKVGRPRKDTTPTRSSRDASLAYLNAFSETEARSIPHKRLGPLVRRGYLKAKGGGYVRTGKAFTV